MCSAAPPQPEIQLLPEIDELLAKRSRSSTSAEIKYTAHFTNNTTSNVDIIWKDFQGDEVVVRRNLKPGVSHRECAYFSHPFLARDRQTGALRSFHYQSNISVIFEGLEFGVHPDDEIQVSICTGQDIQPENSSVPSQPSALQKLYKDDSASYGNKDKFLVHFRNDTASNVNLTWKTSDGVEVMVEHNIKPGNMHQEFIHASHSFIAKDSLTGGLKWFCYKSKSSVIFQGHCFDINSNKVSKVRVVRISDES